MSHSHDAADFRPDPGRKRHHGTSRSSGFRITLLTAPSPRLAARMANAAFVPDYSGGTAVDLHHLPF